MVSNNFLLVSYNTINQNFLDSDVRHSLFPSFRRASQGPEIKLVYSFLDTLDVSDTDCKVIVFLEPRLEIGYPDIVLVYWNHELAYHWSNQRSNLREIDLKVLQFLQTSGYTPYDTLRNHYGSKVDKILDRLHQSGLLHAYQHSCRTRSIRQIFAIEKIISIEAKISWWQTALEQAVQNFWFANDSYVLFPREPSRLEFFEKASHYGVGLLVFNQSNSFSFSNTHSDYKPISYASWLFNEWVWKILYFS